MNPRLLNRVCAHPVAISWVMGAGALNLAVITILAAEMPLTALVADWQATLFLLAAAIPTSLLGYFAGIFMCWPFVRRLCSRTNGAPFRAGDRVVVLAGKLRGTVARVGETQTGQGGWPLVSLVLSPDEQRDRSRVFEEYSLFRTSDREDG